MDLDACKSENTDRLPNAKCLAHASYSCCTAKNSPKTKFLGRTFLGHQGPTRRDIPDPSPGCPGEKLYARCLSPWFLDGFREGMAGMSRDLGLDVPGSERLYARKL